MFQNKVYANLNFAVRFLSNYVEAMLTFLVVFSFGHLILFISAGDMLNVSAVAKLGPISSCVLSDSVVKQLKKVTVIDLPCFLA